MDEQAQALAPEEQMINLLGGDEETQEVNDSEEVEQVEEETQEEEREPEPEYFDLVVNGEQIKVTKEEAINLAQMGKDYTQKTQRVAEERKALEAQMAAFKQQADLQAAIIDKVAEAKSIEAQLSQYSQVDWNALIQADPVQAMQLDRQHRDLRDQLQGKYQEINSSMQQAAHIRSSQYQEMLAKEHQSLMDALPEWRDSAKAAAERNQLKSYLLSSGYDEQAIDGLADHKAVVIARKAMLYDQLMSKKPQVENKIAAAPKPVKPGAAPQRSAKQENYSRLKSEALKSGKTDAAARAIEALL